MKKNKKQQNKSQRNVDYPEVVDMDSLSYLNDDDLSRRLEYLFVERDRYLRDEVEVMPWDVEICYVQREMKIRNNRRIEHDKYMKSNFDLQLNQEQSKEIDPKVLN